MRFPVMSEKQFEDTKGGNQNPLIKEGYTTQWHKKKGQATTYKTLHIKLKIE